MKYSATLFFLFMSATALSAELNPLLGKWARAANQCGNDVLIFEADRAFKVADADGQALKHEFKKVTYETKKDSVVVDFHEQHGLGLSADKTHLTFKIESADRIELVGRRDKSQIFTRCPR